MSKTTKILAVLMFTLLLVPAAQATNGTNLIGIGPISRAMGGGGVAAPQDAISAVFANPAAVCFGPFCPGAAVDFAGTWFDPTVNAKITGFSLTPLEGDSKLNPFVVPAVGVSMPINPRWRFDTRRKRRVWRPEVSWRRRLSFGRCSPRATSPEPTPCPVIYSGARRTMPWHTPCAVLC